MSTTTAADHQEIRTAARRFELARRASLEDEIEGDRIKRSFPTDRMGRVVCPEGRKAIDDYEQGSLREASDTLMDSWRYLRTEITRVGAWGCIVEGVFYCAMSSDHTWTTIDGTGYPVFPAHQILNLDA